MAACLGIDLVAYRIGPAGELLDATDRWKSRSGISSQGALLVRPDGFVAWRARKQSGDLELEIEQTLTRVLFCEPIQAHKACCRISEAI